MIDKKMTLQDLAFVISEQLDKHGISAVLVGGAVVSIYTENEYQSYDLDFCSTATTGKIDVALEEVGFKKKGKNYFHRNTEFFVEFPGSVVVLGEERQTEFSKLEKEGRFLKLLSPTQSIKDRLAAYYHWKDLQSLDQAVMIAKNQKFSLESVKKWSADEGEITKFKEFSEKLKK